MIKKRLFILGVIVLVTVPIVAFIFSSSLYNKDKDPLPPLVSENYVALGDSVAAGVGLKDASDASACNRTEQAYPKVVARTLNYTVTNLACSGATIPAGLLGVQEVNKLQIPAQLQQLFALPKPDVISLTIGANDVQWSSMLRTCYTAVCGSSTDEAIIRHHLSDMRADLTKALIELQQHYAANSGKPRVFVTGYYQVFPDAVTAACSDITGLDAAELAWGRKVQADINATIQTAVGAQSSATFVPVNFVAHELCTSEPWIQGLGAPQPYHPTAAGQAAIAKSLQAAIAGSGQN